MYGLSLHLPVCLRIAGIAERCASLLTGCSDEAGAKSALLNDLTCDQKLRVVCSVTEESCRGGWCLWRALECCWWPLAASALRCSGECAVWLCSHTSQALRHNVPLASP